MFRFYNSNPRNKIVGDCVIRAVSKATGDSWDETYDNICAIGKELKDMPSSNAVWGTYLKRKGMTRHIIPNNCPDCYSVKDFCLDNPQGIFILSLDGHVTTVMHGNYYDTYDCGDEVPFYYWEV